MRALRLAVPFLSFVGAACASSPAATRGTVASSSTAPAAASAPAAPATGLDVLRLMHDRYAATWYHTLTFTQATEIRLPNDSVVRQTWYETGMIPGLLRIDRGARDGRNAIVFRGDSTYSRRDGGPWRAARSRNVLMTLGFDVYGQAPEESARVLGEEGYDLSRVSTATWEGRPVYVVGAAAGDSTSTQFWVDRERLVYVRSLERGLRDTTQRAEIVFGAYAPLGGGWIAKEVTVREGGRMLQRETYTDVRADVPVSAEFFDPAKM